MKLRGKSKKKTLRHRSQSLRNEILKIEQKLTAIVRILEQDRFIDVKELGITIDTWPPELISALSL